MIRLGVAADEPSVSAEERRWRRDARSAWLRLAVLGILVANLLVGEHDGNLLVHSHVVGGYAIATALALILAQARRGPVWLGTAFIVIDAAAVVALFHEHLCRSSSTLEHSLTTASLAIAFVLLNHAALRLRPALVVLYAGLVTVGWLSLLAIRSALTGWHDEHSLSVLFADSTLAVAFGFAAFVAFLLIQDHNVLLRTALKTERRRVGLSRFFSPSVVAELQADGIPTELQRRQAGVMFVDLRSFTRFAESAASQALADLLVDYRNQVTDIVFRWQGTVDKFIGDGVMIVFGQPKPKPDDAERALRCALHLSRALALWKTERQNEGRPALDAGIGLHFGEVIGGILQSAQHDEFTVLGDAVNVSERLERLTKTLDASLVVSGEALALVPDTYGSVPWTWKDGVELEGRSGTLRIAYLQRSQAAEINIGSGR
jgi:adenylate cyclase